MYGKVKKVDTDYIADFFLMNFRYIWYDMGVNKAKAFRSYRVIDCEREFFNNADALEYSLEDVKYELDQRFSS